MIGIFMRVNPSFLFFSVMAGELLGRYFGDDAELVIKTVTNNEEFTHYAEAIVIILPVLFTAVFLKHTIEKAKLLYLWIPFLVTGVVLAAFILPTLPESLIELVKSTQVGYELVEASDFIVGVVVAFQLISLWVLNRKHSVKRKSGKH